MKILHYCANPGGFIYDWHHHHMVDELRRAGHDVTYFNPIGALGREGYSDDYAEALMDHVRENDKSGPAYDLFFGTVTDATLDPGAIDEIRRRGTPAVNLSTDDYSHPFRVKRVARHFDLNWSTVRENLSILKGYGAKVTMMPWGANPHVFHPVETHEAPVVGFIGTAYGARARNIALLQQAGVPVRVHGRSPQDFYQSVSAAGNPLGRAFSNYKESWERVTEGLSFSAGRKCISSLIWRSVLEMQRKLPEQHLDNEKVEYLPSPPFPEMSEKIGKLAISLGSIELCSTYVFRKPLLFIRLREFEVAMSGGVHLVNRFPELEEYFEPEKEMLFYNDAEELVEKARFYLQPSQDAARRKIRERARKRSVAEHTWIVRFRAIGDLLGISFDVKSRV